jgi:hypothetical protein
MKSTDWGINPGKTSKSFVANRPTIRRSLQTLIRTHGYKARMPRERPFVEKFGHSRAHNPPPKFGRVMRNLSLDPARN